MGKMLISGRPACQGKIEGEVFVVKDDAEIKNFTKGSILVAPFTKPSYVPAMIKSVGIITDIGGLTSHAAIIAREMGIPCVVATKNATSVLQTGQKIVMDAVTGEIYEK
ncbi:MAG: hypothetical protein GY793_02600 [Proteobacteria bacterium]|nr:hypothetical protein [Pseudomonadota bacterium]